VTSFTERIARHLDRPIDAACGARPRGTLWTSAWGGGVGAAPPVIEELRRRISPRRGGAAR
jgi:hypothetical protein